MNEAKHKNMVGLLSSIFAIVVGLLFGFIVLLASNPTQAVPGFFTILTGSFTHGLKGIGQVFYYATPIILTGLSVGFAFKTGLFNIGTPGQFIVGAFAAIVVGIRGDFLGSAQWVVAVLASIAAGALWGLVPGVLNAYFNVNVVIACIMMNYIGMYLINFIVKGSKTLFDSLRNQSLSVDKAAEIPKMGLNLLFPESSINGGFFIAILAVVLIHFILNKTAFGFELKAAGFNRDASKYAG
ncbi:ABC transporter permease, partial [Lachnotalea glycerini]